MQSEGFNLAETLCALEDRLLDQTLDKFNLASRFEDKGVIMVDLQEATLSCRINSFAELLEFLLHIKQGQWQKIVVRTALRRDRLLLHKDTFSNSTSRI